MNLLGQKLQSRCKTVLHKMEVIFGGRLHHIDNFPFEGIPLFFGAEGVIVHFLSNGSEVPSFKIDKAADIRVLCWLDSDPTLEKRDSFSFILVKENKRAIEGQKVVAD